MKNTLPAIPHSIRWVIERSNAGRESLSGILEFQVPSRVAAHLSEDNGVSFIHSAQIGYLDCIAIRVRNWKGTIRGAPSFCELLEAAAAEGCDTTIRVSISPNEWHLIGHLCGRLRITPGQWFAACAAYNAGVEEENLERSLASLADVPD